MNLYEIDYHHWFILLLCFVLLNLYVIPVYCAEKRVALVIGNENYKKNTHPLSSSIDDARFMENILRQVGFIVTLVTDINYSDMKKEIKAFKEKLGEDEDTVALFYYSGHAVQYANKNYLIPINIISDILVADHLQQSYPVTNLDYMIAVMKKAKQGIVILDGYRDSPFRNIHQIKSGLSGSTTIVGANNVSIAYAALPSTPTLESSDRTNFYTKYLVKFIIQPGLDIDFMLKKVRTEVKRKTSGMQVPWVRNPIDFIFTTTGTVEPHHIRVCSKKKYDNIQNVNSVAWSPNGNFALSAGDSKIQLWKMKSSKLKRVRTFYDGSSHVNSVSFSPNEKEFLSGHKNGEVHLWNMDNKVPIYTKRKNRRSVNSVSFSPNGNQVLAGSNDGTMWLWNKEGKFKHRYRWPYSSKNVLSVAFSANGKILSGTKNGMYLWENKKAEKIPLFNGNSCNSVKFFIKSQENYILGGCGKEVQIWNWKKKKPKFTPHRVLKGHSGKVYSVDVSPDGHYVLSGSLDNTVHFWDVDNEKILDTFKGYSRYVSFSPNGNYILLGGNEGIFLGEICKKIK
jgi:WD40 repeat protein